VIPLLAILRVRGQRSLSLWLPLFLIWLLLLPVLLLLSPVALVALLIARNNPWAAISAFWGVLCGVRGTRIEVVTPGKMVLIQIY
jgi:hypothetical protein